MLNRVRLFVFCRRSLTLQINDDNDNDDNNDDGHDNDKAVFVIFLTFAFVLSYRFQSENMMNLFRPINWFLLQNCYRVDELLITDLPTDQDQMVI